MDKCIMNAVKISEKDKYYAVSSRVWFSASCVTKAESTLVLPTTISLCSLPSEPWSILASIHDAATKLNSIFQPIMSHLKYVPPT